MLKVELVVANDVLVANPSVISHKYCFVLDAIVSARLLHPAHEKCP